MYSQTARVTVRAPRAEVFDALLDPEAVATWRTPDNMTAEVLEWQPEVGGRFRVSLTYRDEAGDETGKTEGRTDTYSGRFAEIVSGEQVVEVTSFESDDPGMAGEMTMTTNLRDVPEGTEVELRHDGIPDAVPPEQNETGTRMSLAKLAAYVEAG